MLKRLSLTLLPVTIMVLCASAQPRGGGDAPQYGNHLYAEVLQLPSDSVSLTRIEVLLRVAHDYVIFSKSGNPHPDSLYVAGLEIGIDMQTDGMTVASVNHAADVYAGDYTATTLRDRYLLFRQTFYLPPDHYEAVLTVSDQGSSRSRILRRRILAVDLSAEGTRIGQPISMQISEDAAGNKYSVYGYGGTLPFAANTTLGIPVPESWDGDWRVRLHPLDEDGDLDGEAVFDDMLQPIDVLRNTCPQGPPGLVSNYLCTPGAPAVGNLVVLSLPVARHDVGRYRLTIQSVGPSSADTLTIDTRIYWRSMPYSLRDIEFAIDAMRYILTYQEYDRMRSGSEREMNIRFRRYWKEQDPTPDTEYNERMVEYFRRVDAAVDRFQTLYERNGAMTDRGKVYILFGPPEETQRILNSDEPAEEIWYYPTLDKTFRFIDRNRNGDLRLYEE